MFEIDAIVTMSTRTGLKITANWPLIWLEKPGCIQVQRNLLPNEIVPSVDGVTQRAEFAVDRGLLWDLRLGDRVLIRCFLEDESVELATASLDPDPENVIYCQEAFQRSAVAAAGSHFHS